MNVSAEIMTLKIFCKALSVTKSVSLKNIKKNERNHDHPSFVSKTCLGIPPSVTILYANV